MLAVPDGYKYSNLERMLLPLDYSASFQRKNMQFLINQKIFRRTKMSVWEIGDLSTTRQEESSVNKKIFSEIEGIIVDFYTLDKTTISKDTCGDVQKQFQLIILMGKNIKFAMYSCTTGRDFLNSFQIVFLFWYCTIRCLQAL